MSDQPTPGVDDRKVISDAPAEQSKTEKEQTQAAVDYRDRAEQGQSKNKDTNSIEVKVYSPFRDYYDGPAFSVSAENETGPFDVLPNHHNFITLLTACDVLVRTIDKGDQKIRISGGIMHVKANQAIVFLDV